MRKGERKKTERGRVKTDSGGGRGREDMEGKGESGEGKEGRE